MSLAAPMVGRKPKSQSGKSMRRRREFIGSVGGFGRREVRIRPWE
jgi:hypothetical protein